MNRFNGTLRTLRPSFSRMAVSDPLSSLIMSTVNEWHIAKHPAFSLDEIGLANSLAVAACPECGSRCIVRNGKRPDGIQAYLCLDCGRKFNPLSGTIFDGHKMPVSEWIEFLIHLFQYESLLCSSLDNQNAYNTGRYWLKKVFLILDGYQDGILLSGDVGVDECFLVMKPKDLIVLEGGKKLRGTSRNRHCVYCAADGSGAVLLPYGKGSPSRTGERNTVIPHMVAASSFHDDGDSAHNAIVKDLGLPRTVYPTKCTKGLKDKDDPMDDINSVHREFKRLMTAHGAYGRRNVLGYCNLESFIYAHHGDKAAMVLDMLRRSFECGKVLRYREALKKHG